MANTMAKHGDAALPVKLLVELTNNGIKCGAVLIVQNETKSGEHKFLPRSDL
jgi:hypothetical protein